MLLRTGILSMEISIEVTLRGFMLILPIYMSLPSIYAFGFANIFSIIFMICRIIKGKENNKSGTTINIVILLLSIFLSKINGIITENVHSKNFKIVTEKPKV